MYRYKTIRTQSKATIALFLSEKPERTLSTALHKQGPNTKNPQIPGALINNESTTTEPPPWDVQQLKPQGWISPWILHLFNFGSSYNLEYAALI